MKNNLEMPWLKIILWGALGIHIILISLSILEVAIYSLIINPGKEESFYTAHAQISAPYISIIFGIIVFYFVARFISKNKWQIYKKIGIWLAIIYFVVDLGILFISKVNWSEIYLVIIISSLTKFTSSYLGARSVRKKNIINSKNLT